MSKKISNDEYQKLRFISQPISTAIRADRTEFDLYNKQQLKKIAFWSSYIEPQRLIYKLFDDISKKFKTDYHLFINPQYQIILKRGKMNRLPLHFQLEYYNSHLGLLKLSRSTKYFSEREIQRMQLFLKPLLLPLKNALNYYEAQQNALVDALTGAANRFAFTKLLQDYKDISSRLSVLVIDIDSFKSVNDTYGHLAGDELLKSVSQTILRSVRKTDKVYRIGGEEFFVLLERVSLNEAYEFSKRICHAVSNVKCSYQNQLINITVSIGIASFQQNDQFVSLFERADNALYLAKSQGGNRVCSELDLSYKKLKPM